MRKRILGLAAGLGLVMLAGPALAENWWSDIWRDYHRNKNWPQPFVHQDRAVTLMPFAVMQNNGWERENLLGAHHFTPDSMELSELGKLRAQWILTQAPIHRRTIFVEFAGDPQKTASRLRAVQQVSSHFLPPGQLADVRPTNMVTEGWPADAVERTNVQFMESRPTPVLPAVSVSGTE